MKVGYVNSFVVWFVVTESRVLLLTNQPQGGHMMNNPRINKAVFKYNGDAEAFERFMQALISDYLDDNNRADISVKVSVHDDEIEVVLKSA